MVGEDLARVGARRSQPKNYVTSDGANSIDTMAVRYCMTAVARRLAGKSSAVVRTSTAVCESSTISVVRFASTSAEGGPSLKGVFVPLVTTFTDDEKQDICYDSMKRNLEIYEKTPIAGQYCRFK